MATFIGINAASKIVGHIENHDVASRAHLLADEQAGFVGVDQWISRAVVDIATLQPGWDWDGTQGVEPDDVRDARLADEAPRVDALAAKTAVVEIAAGTFSGSNALALRAIARVLVYLMRNLI